MEQEQSKNAKASIPKSFFFVIYRHKSWIMITRAQSREQAFKIGFLGRVNNKHKRAKLVASKLKNMVDRKMNRYDYACMHVFV